MDRDFIKTLPSQPGIYQMFDAHGHVLYVGKARDLKKRVSSYFRQTGMDPKTHALMQQVERIEVMITRTENEALLLESNFIKKLRPHYNILLRDDKSYPYLFLSSHPEYPRLDFHRGAKRAKGRYFGPYPSAGAVRETLNLLQKFFRIRQCTDTFFTHRSRPCIQYQIKRCTGPCVGYITPQDYQANVKLTVQFLEGKTNQVIQFIANKMEQASKALNYEEAAHLRDLIGRIRQIQQKQCIYQDSGDIDVIAVIQRYDVVCVEVVYIRAGRVIGHKSFFPATPKSSTPKEVLNEFLPQYYLSPTRGEVIPSKIIVNHKLPNRTWIQNALREHLNQRVVINYSARDKYRQWLKLAEANAGHALGLHVQGRLSMMRRLEQLQRPLHLPSHPRRIECFDISHTHGELTVASCVVFDATGAVKDDYRRFNIEGIQKGDDYAAIEQALTRRYTRMKEGGGEGRLPDIVMIDGGRGQLSKAQAVMEELQISGVILLAIAKGPGRKPGLETLYLSGCEHPVTLSEDSPALHFLQQVRDEAHRFAITGHRLRRGKVSRRSALEEIPGVGAKRRRELLRQFGGIKEIKAATVEELARVPGISPTLAQRIYEILKGSDPI